MSVLIALLLKEDSGCRFCCVVDKFNQKDAAIMAGAAYRSTQTQARHRREVNNNNCIMNP